MYWFTVAKDSSLTTVSKSTAASTIERIEVEPEDITLYVGSVHRFKATGYDTNNNPVAVDCSWTIVPADGGTLVSPGRICIGTKPCVAIIATYNGIKGYATVYTEGGSFNRTFDAKTMMRKLFGIPVNNE